MSRPPEPKPARYDTPQTVIDDLLAALESAPEPPTLTMNSAAAAAAIDRCWQWHAGVRAAALAKVRAAGPRS